MGPNGPHFKFIYLVGIDYERFSTLMGPMVPTLSSYTLLAWIMRVKLAIGSLLCLRAFW